MADKRTNSLALAVVSAVSLWADHTTGPNSPRRTDLMRDKSKAVLDFLAFTDRNWLGN